jgi:hypothetical protein
MTNFEKWKKNAKIDDLIKFINLECEDCPCFDTCNSEDIADCEKRIEVWAEQEATNDETN